MQQSEVSNTISGYIPTTVVVPNQSPEIGKIALALAKAQGIIGNAHKDSANPFFKSSYADLASCWDACREALAKNELAVIQTHSAGSSGDVVLTTKLIHSSGQFFTGTINVRPSKNDPQGYGSATTYARRYGLCAMVGISPADDDGNAASGKVAKPQKARKSAKSSKVSVTKVDKEVESKQVEDDDDEF